jgi:hypothetical protein
MTKRTGGAKQQTGPKSAAPLWHGLRAQLLADYSA